MTTELSVSKIEQNIYFIRGRQVMLDSDLASLYAVETRILNQAVRRNEKRFPGDDFTFRLNAEEHNSLRSQIVILENDKNHLKSDSSLLEDSLRSQIVILESAKGKHRKFLPTVFTEAGALMLSSVLNSDRAIEINVAVVKAFVEFRRKFNARSPIEERMGQLEEKVNQIEQTSQTILHAIQQLRFGVHMPPSQSQLPAPALADNHTERKKSENPAFAKSVHRVVETIQKEVAQYYGIKVQDLKTATRLRAISLPRQVAIYLIRKHTQLGFKDIGKIFDGKNHTTAMHAFQKIKSSIDQDEAIRESITAIEEHLQA
jgi:phage regulator Rha-like protein